MARTNFFEKNEMKPKEPKTYWETANIDADKKLELRKTANCRLSMPTVVIVLSSPIFSIFVRRDRQRFVVTLEYGEPLGDSLRLDSSYDTRCF